MGEESKISIENRDIERVYKTKFLGVVIDSKLNWRCHIDYIANRISKNIGIIVKVKTILNLKTAKYYSCIYPYLNYCCVWGLACITYLSKLHIIQKRIARLILGKQKYYPSHGLFKKLDMLSIMIWTNALWVCSATNPILDYCLMCLITSLLKYLTFIDIIQDLSVISMFERRVLFMLINP